MHHMRYQNKGKMLSLNLEDGLYPTSERSLQKVILIFSPFSTFDLEINDLDLGQGHSN